MNNSQTISNNRIHIADVLRGLAVAGILLLHCIEHFNFYSFPDPKSELMRFSDKAIWDSLFFMFGGKMYAIFSLLFGLSFFIQFNNQAKKGNDFGPRFLWRLFLLLLIGFFDAAFFTGEILVLYALVGIIMIPCSKISTSSLKYLALFLFIQPVEIFRIFQAIFISDYQMSPSLSGHYFGIAYKAQMGESFWEMMKVNLWEGQLASLTWAWDNGRVTQTAFLFIIGMIIGRNSLLTETKENLHFWFKVLLISIFCFFPLKGLQTMLPEFIETTTLRVPLTIIIRMWGNFAFTMILFSSIILVFYQTSLRSKMMHLAPYGKMSLTNYVTQSIIGAFIFYGWGLGAYSYMGHTYSVLTGVVILILQYTFCVYWLKRYNHGPLEYLWKRATWINSSNQIVKSENIAGNTAN